MSLLQPEAAPTRRRIEPVTTAIAGIILLLAAGAALYLFWRWQTQVVELPVLSGEARAYLPYLDLVDVQMGAEDSFLEQRLVTIEGKIANLGDQAVMLVEVNCVFRDVNGLEIDRVPAVIVGGRTGPLQAGDQQSFRLAFDALPQEWNQTMPSLFVSRVEFNE
jgi:hypothetical protein